jgi:hypothetical protein
MSQEYLESLMWMSIEKEMLTKINPNDVYWYGGCIKMCIKKKLMY